MPTPLEVGSQRWTTWNHREVRWSGIHWHACCVSPFHVSICRPASYQDAWKNVRALSLIKVFLRRWAAVAFADSRIGMNRQQQQQQQQQQSSNVLQKHFLTWIDELDIPKQQHHAISYISTLLLSSFLCFPKKDGDLLPTFSYVYAGIRYE